MDAAASARAGGQGGVVPRESRPSWGRTALSGSSRHHAGGKVHTAVGLWGAGEPRVRQNRVVPTPEILCVKPSRRWRGQPAAHRSGSRAVTGAIVQRSPRRARHKPSDHRAGKAVCWASPVCCCAVFLRVPFAQQTAGAAGTRPSLRPPALDGRKWSKARASSAARLFTHVRAKTPAVVPANAGTHTPQPTFGEDRP